ncbi:hypothetical protein [Fusibacter sp. JL216-2]|uniref:hypothetical protein n=1 Tax=Fusibacter sp. JL216-2 TaxID=3071453 RepID=UPI003D357B77
MEFRSLKLIDRFQWVFTRMGIDYGTMRKILNLKLIMDSRRIPTAIQNNKKGKDDTGQGNNMLKSLWMYALFSVMPGIMAFIPIPIFSKISIIMGISMFLIMSTMISDFSSVLLDIRDKNILMAFPVDSRTLSAAKLVHICIYLSLITGSLNFIPLIGIAYSEGILMGLLLLLMLVFMVMVVIFLTSLMYVLVLKKFDGEKLKDLISSIQIMLTVAMTLGYQVVARMFEFSNVHVQFTPKWWTILLPPTWFAAPFALLSGQSGFLYILLAILGVCLPLVFIILHFKVITPLFEANLVKLNTSDKHASKAYNRRQVRVKKLSKIFCRSKDEQAAFQFGYRMLSSERELKQKVYPSMALSIVFPFILGATLVSDTGGISQALESFRTSNQYLWIYFSVLILPSVFIFVGRSKYYKGAWLYKVLPIEDPYPIISGTYKSAIIKFGVPPFFITAVLMVILAGIRVVPHMGIAFINTIYMVLIISMLNGTSLPFSRSFQVTQDGHMKGSLAGMVCTGLLGGLHLLLIKFSTPLIDYIVFLILFVILIPFWKHALRTTWEEIHS